MSEQIPKVFNKFQTNYKRDSQLEDKDEYIVIKGARIRNQSILTIHQEPGQPS